MQTLAIVSYVSQQCMSMYMTKTTICTFPTSSSTVSWRSASTWHELKLDSIKSDKELPSLKSLKKKSLKENNSTASINLILPPVDLIYKLLNGSDTERCKYYSLSLSSLMCLERSKNSHFHIKPPRRPLPATPLSAVFTNVHTLPTLP